MTVLRIEHPVPDFAVWKEAFDRDPVGRQRCGVRRYRIMRPADDPHYVLIDLEFDTSDEAESLLASMREVWDRVKGVVMTDPQARIVETVEAEEYPA
jgi:hypothetical protein